MSSKFQKTTTLSVILVFNTVTCMLFRLEADPHLFEVFVELARPTPDNQPACILQQYPLDYNEEVCHLYKNNFCIKCCRTKLY